MFTRSRRKNASDRCLPQTRGKSSNPGKSPPSATATDATGAIGWHPRGHGLWILPPEKMNQRQRSSAPLRFKLSSAYCKTPVWYVARMVMLVLTGGCVCPFHHVGTSRQRSSLTTSTAAAAKDSQSSTTETAHACEMRLIFCNLVAIINSRCTYSINQARLRGKVKKGERRKAAEAAMRAETVLHPQSDRHHSRTASSQSSISAISRCTTGSGRHRVPSAGKGARRRRQNPVSHRREHTSPKPYSLKRQPASKVR